MDASRPAAVPQPLPDRVPPVAPPALASAPAGPVGGRYLVVRGGSLVGSSELECALPASRAAIGRLRPDRGFEDVRPVFALYPVALQRDDADLLHWFVERRNMLELRVLGPGGTELDARVDLISRWDDGILVVHTTMHDERYWHAR